MKDRISARQLLVLLFAALLSPAVRALPTWTVDTAGEGAWLTGVFVFVPLLVTGWILFDLFRIAGQSGGLADIFIRVLGKFFGKTLIILYFLWALLLLSVDARLYGERMLGAGYRNASLSVFLLVLLGIVLWMGRKKLAAFARAAEIFYLALSFALILVLAFSILDLNPGNVLPIWFEDVPGITVATLAPMGVVGAGIFAAFLGGQVTPNQGDRRRALRWLAAGCLALAAIQFAVLAQLGPELGGRLSIPFFEIAKGVGVSGAFQRVESIVIALWVLSDLLLLGLLVFACRTMVKTLLNGRGGRWTVPIIIVVTFLGALFLFPDGFAVRNMDRTVVLYGNLCLGFAVPAAVWLIARMKYRKGGRIDIGGLGKDMP